MVTWEAPMMPNGIIVSYRVEFTRNTDNFIDNITTANQSVMIDMLEKYTTYMVQVFASTVAEGNGSEVVTVTTDEDSEFLLYLHTLLTCMYYVTVFAKN